MILYPDTDFPEAEVGQKAIRLLALQRLGYNVPKFVVVPVSTIKSFSQLDAIRTTQLWNEVRIFFGNLPVAIRSAALIEDGSTSSYAGQFMTELNVGTDDESLRTALVAVIDDAEQKGYDQKLSVIFQEYIEPDFAGVLFTREVQGGTEMMIEYVTGSGDKAVGGEKVTRLQFVTRACDTYEKQLPGIGKLAKAGSAIETYYDFPQDIEWAIKDGIVYLLQTRPITTLHKDQWLGLKYIDCTITESDYFYERTMLAESFETPKPLAFSVLQSLYANDGPVHETYKRLKILFSPTNQVAQIGNEVFVNKQAELQSLFPAMGYFKHQTEQPTWERLRGTWQTLGNAWRFSVFSPGPTEELRLQVDRLLSQELDKKAMFDERYAFFLHSYQCVFEISLRSQKAITNVQKLFPNKSTVLTELMTSVPQPSRHDFSNYIGNSVSIDDHSDFVAADPKLTRPTIDTEGLLEELPVWKQKIAIPYIETLQEYLALREQARWVSVRLISYVRRAVEAKSAMLDDSTLIYFAKLDELLADEVVETVCAQRKQMYEHQINLTFPKKIASFSLHSKKGLDTVGLSGGIAEGIVVTIDTIQTAQGPKILYTDTLSPHLTKYFGQIVGIVTHEGGLLSHLAIVARESSVPVVVSSKKIDAGKYIKINGSTGKIIEVLQ